MVEETIKTIKETENEADEIIRKADATCTEGEVLKKQASEKTEQETEALKALAQGKEEEAVSAVIKALL